MIEDLYFCSVCDCLMSDEEVIWSYTIKVDRKLCVIICLLRHKNERTFMSGFKRYDEEFKQSLV
ncbi:hypothetical protein, partial [Lactococcus petauri]|uniref:hypothetical protein n=1 Tax=Lactococcus petauri TaxID=1940789 RepID=UPI00254BD24F